MVALVVILGGWIAGRALLWEDPFVSGQLSSRYALAGAGRVDGQGGATGSQNIGQMAASVPNPAPAEARSGPRHGKESGWMPPVATPRQGPLVVYDAASDRQQGHPEDRFTPFAPFPGMDSRVTSSRAERVSASEPQVQPVPVRIAAGHQLLWMAALARMPFPMDAVAQQMAQSTSATSLPTGREQASRKRWLADGWLLLRRGGDASLANGATPATYGASQIGAVLRYSLMPASAHRPTAYIRATSALNGSSEREAAVGLSVRPLVAVPVRVGAELRASDRRGGTELRPAAIAVIELPSFALPLGGRGEVYAQAGYVGGKYDTAFADGQVRIDRRIARLGRAELRAGAGGWAGAQKGASRVDVGPTANVGLPVSDTAAARLGLDWRFRVTGNARPSSGPAMTLSAGF